MKEYKQLSPEAMTIKALSGELEFAKFVAGACRNFMTRLHTITVLDSDGHCLATATGLLMGNKYGAIEEADFIESTFDDDKTGEFGIDDDDLMPLHGRIDSNGDLIVTLIPRS